MPFDPSSYSPKARAAYIREGRQWGSPITLAQARHTLQGWRLHGPKVEPRGFGPEDAETLHGVEQFLTEAGVDREEVRGDVKLAHAAYARTFDAGKKLRVRARGVLIAVSDRLEEREEAPAEQAVEQIGVVLAQVSRAGGDAETLAGQLDLLHGLFTHPLIQEVSAKRGGTQLEPELVTQSAALREAARNRPARRGTPVETEILDLADGIIVRLARQARRAARVAADELGEPSLVGAFELVHLQPSRGPSAPPVPPA